MFSSVKTPYKNLFTAGKHFRKKKKEAEYKNCLGLCKHVRDVCLGVLENTWDNFIVKSVFSP